MAGLVLCELLSRAAPSETVFKRVVPGFGINAYELVAAPYDHRDRRLTL